jgi:hypothetical protein
MRGSAFHTMTTDPFADFTVFQGRRQSVKNKLPRVAAQVRGSLSLNQAAYDGLGAPPAVEFLYNARDGAIALRGAALEVTHAAPIRKQANSQSYLVMAKSFLDDIGLDYATSAGVTVFDDVQILAEQHALLLSTKHTHRVPARHRKPRAAADG